MDAAAASAAAMASTATVTGQCSAATSPQMKAPPYASNFNTRQTHQHQRHDLRKGCGTEQLEFVADAATERIHSENFNTPSRKVSSEPAQGLVFTHYASTTTAATADDDDGDDGDKIRIGDISDTNFAKISSSDDPSLIIEHTTAVIPTMHALVERHTPGAALAMYDNLIKTGRIQESLKILEEMERKDVLDINMVYHSRFYQECKRQLAVNEAFRFTKLIHTPTMSTFNMLLGVCCAAADTNGAFRTLTALERHGFKADCALYTTLISTCAKAARIDLLFNVVEEMKRNRVKGNVKTYGAIIDGCARSNETEKAFEVYKEMISKKVRPDRVIFNSLMFACARSGAVELAFEVIAEMKSSRIPLEPNHYTMCSLIGACARAGEVECAYEVYKLLRSNGIRKTREVYTAAVHSCSLSGNLQRAFSIYEDMKTDKVKPDEVFFSALIDVAGHARNIEAAFTVLAEVEKMALIPGPTVFSSIMGVCCNMGNWEKALQLYENIQSLGIRPTVSTLNALIRALCSGGQFENAIHSFKEMKKVGVIPNQITYTLLLEACEKNKEAEIAFDLYRGATCDGVPPNLIMCSSIISLCLDGIRKGTEFSRPMGTWSVRSREEPHQKWMSWAIAVYRRTLSQGLVPTQKLFSQFLGCLRIPETPDNILREDASFALYESSTILSKEMVDGFGVYDPRASSLYEEAAQLGIVPHFSCDAAAIIFDAECLHTHAAEVCVLTILKALRHRCAIDAKLPSLTIKFECERKSVINADGTKQASINVLSRNGQAIAAVLRRLRLRFNGKESSGKLWMSSKAIFQMFKPSSVMDNIHKPMFASPSFLGKNISEQQRAIRMDGPY